MTTMETPTPETVNRLIGSLRFCTGMEALFRHFGMDPDAGFDLGASAWDARPSGDEASVFGLLVETARDLPDRPLLPMPLDEATSKSFYTLGAHILCLLANDYALTQDDLMDDVERETGIEVLAETEDGSVVYESLTAAPDEGA